MNTIRLLPKQELSAYLAKEASLACSAHNKISWMQQHLQQGGFIPIKIDHPDFSSIASIVRENREKNLLRYNLRPSTTHIEIQKLMEKCDSSLPKVAVEIGGGNSSLAIDLIKKGWKVTVIDPCEPSLILLAQRAIREGLGSLIASHLDLVNKKMEDCVFPKEVSLIVAQSSLPYCNPLKLEDVFKKTYASLNKGGVFIGETFHLIEEMDKECTIESQQMQILQGRVHLGVWFSTIPVTYSLFRHAAYNPECFVINGSSVSFLGRK